MRALLSHLQKQPDTSPSFSFPQPPPHVPPPMPNLPPMARPDGKVSALAATPALAPRSREECTGARPCSLLVRDTLQEFNYVRDTPRITVLTPLPLMQGSAGGAPPRPTSQVLAAPELPTQHAPPETPPSPSISKRGPRPQP